MRQEQAGSDTGAGRALWGWIRGGWGNGGGAEGKERGGCTCTPATDLPLPHNVL